MIISLGSACPPRALCMTVMTIVISIIVVIYIHFMYQQRENQRAHNVENVLNVGETATMHKPVPTTQSIPPIPSFPNELFEKYRAPQKPRKKHADALKCIHEEKNMIKAQKCLVKIAQNWLYDDDISKHHNCTVHAFDPSIGKPHSDRGKRIHFYDVGISDKDTLRDTRPGHWPMMSFKTMLTMLDLSNKRVSMVKMDIEYGELIALPLMARDGSLSNVQQLAFEVHLFPSKPVSIYANMFGALEAANFVHYYTRPNEAAPRMNIGGDRYCCYEIYFINKAFITSLQ